MSTSRYPSKARLAGFMQGAGFNRDGLVADAIFPRVQVLTQHYDYIDWGETENKDGVYDNLRTIEDVIGCYSQAKRINPDNFVYKSGKVLDHALEKPLTECGVSACTPDGRLPFSIDQQKAQSLINRLLLNREQVAYDLATDETKYRDLAATTAAIPSITTLEQQAEFAAEGALIDLTTAGQGGISALRDQDYDLLGLMKSIQRNNFKGGRFNKMITNMEAADLMTLNNSFKDGGCVVPAVTSIESIRNLLGLDEVVAADAAVNVALPGGTAQLDRIFGNYILLTRSFDLVQTTDESRFFGFSAFVDGLGQHFYREENKGKQGIEILKAHHDLTPHVADYQSAVLIKY